MNSKRRKAIGILTLHYGSNHGAILQSFSVAQLFNAEIIDHRYQSKLNIYTKTGFDKFYLQQFINESLPLSPQFKVKDYEDGPTLQYIKNNYDLVVYGSDEIWKLHYGFRSRKNFLTGLFRHPMRTVRDYAWLQRHPFFTPFPNIYWPTLDMPAVSFAGSIGETETDKIPSRHKAKMGRSLDRFMMLGVRDTRTKDFFVELRPDLEPRIQLLPDPVFSFKIDENVREQAQNILQDHQVDIDKPFVFVHASIKEHLQRCKDEVRPLGLPIVNLLDIPLNPPQWFAAIGMATCGISSVMHGFISALVQNIPCLSIDQRVKSVELRKDFRLTEYDSLKEIVEKWPHAAIAKEVKRRNENLKVYACKVRSLV